MKRTQRRVWLAGAAATVLAVTLLPPGTAVAQPSSQQVDVTVEVVADGLDVPRGLAYDRLLGRVVVAEAGNSEGNDGACAEGFGGTVYCYGETGALFQYSERWWLPTRRIADGLPSIWAPDLVPAGFDVVLGLHDVALPFGTGPAVGVFGLSGPLSFRQELEQSHPDANLLAQAAWVTSAGTVPFGDIAQLEEDLNPHPANLDSDPYGVETVGLKTIVADAACNCIVEVGLNGSTEVLAVIPNRGIEEAVPTAVVRGPDGALYVGELSAAFSPEPSSRVWRLADDGELTLVADGLLDVISIAFDHQGRLVVLEIANDYYRGGRDGRLLRIEDDGSVTTLIDEGLHTPGGVVAAKPGVFYVTNRSATLGGDGELLKVTVSG
ncbi:MAG: ScyD/ScyE family protein [Natronosporangium sp.]